MAVCLTTAISMTDALVAVKGDCCCAVRRLICSRLMADVDSLSALCDMFANQNKEIQIPHDSNTQNMGLNSQTFDIEAFFGCMGFSYVNDTHGYISISQVSMMRDVMKIVVEV